MSPSKQPVRVETSTQQSSSSSDDVSSSSSSAAPDQPMTRASDVLGAPSTAQHDVNAVFSRANDAPSLQLNKSSGNATNAKSKSTPASGSSSLALTRASDVPPSSGRRKSASSWGLVASQRMTESPARAYVPLPTPAQRDAAVDAQVLFVFFFQKKNCQ